MHLAIFLFHLSGKLLRKFCAATTRLKRHGSNFCISLALLSTLFFSCTNDQAQKKYKVGFSQCTGGDAWRKQMLASMKGELAFYSTIEFRYTDAANSNERQIEDIEGFIKDRVE